MAATVFGIVVVIGASLGIAQWFVLRREASGSGLWVLASAAGPALIYLVALLVTMFTLDRIEGFSERTITSRTSRDGILIEETVSTYEDPEKVVNAAVFAGLVGAMLGYGAITGGAMVWLLGQPEGTKFRLERRTRTRLRLAAVFLIVPIYGYFLFTTIRRNDIIENFDTDPGWMRFNNPANDNDFGFRNSNLAGGTAGEAGGFFSETTVPVWYGDGSVGEFGGSDALCASGIMNIRSVDPGYNGNVFVGHFDNGEFSDGGPNGIGLQVLEPEEEDATSFRIFYLAGTDEGQRFVIEGLNLPRTWSYNYDPKAGDFGSLTISISGPGGGTATHFLASDERDSIGNFETFGLAVKVGDSASTAQVEMYVDNLRYTSIVPCKMP